MNKIEPAVFQRLAQPDHIVQGSVCSCVRRLLSNQFDDPWGLAFSAAKRAGMFDRGDFLRSDLIHPDSCSTLLAPNLLYLPGTMTLVIISSTLRGSSFALPFRFLKRQKACSPEFRADSESMHPATRASRYCGKRRQEVEAKLRSSPIACHPN